jgi:hypothetical protein
MTLTDQEKTTLEKAEALVLEHLQHDGPATERWVLLEALAATIRRLTKPRQEYAPCTCGHSDLDHSEDGYGLLSCGNCSCSNFQR